MKTGKINAIALIGCIALLAACQPGEDAASKPETVEERAQARWDHLLAADFGQAWELYTPGFRQMTPQSDYAAQMRGRPIRWVGARTDEAECSDSRCQVIISVRYRVPGGPTGINQMEMSREIEETWIRTDGQWWYSEG